MLTDELRAEIASLEREIAATDKAIEEAERRQSLRRKHSDSLYGRLLKKKAELERADAPLRKPTGHCVKETMPNGQVWNV